MDDIKDCRQSHYSEAMDQLSGSEDGFTELIEMLEARLLPITRSTNLPPPVTACSKEVEREFVQAADNIRSYAIRWQRRKDRLQSLLDRIEL